MVFLSTLSSGGCHHQCIGSCSRTRKAKLLHKTAAPRLHCNVATSDRNGLWCPQTTLAGIINAFPAHWLVFCFNDLYFKILMSHIRFILIYDSAPAQFKASSMHCAHCAVCSVSLAGWLKGMRADIKADLCYGGLKIASLNWHWVTLVLLLRTELKPKGISEPNIARIANAVPHPSSI